MKDAREMEARVAFLEMMMAQGSTLETARARLNRLKEEGLHKTDRVVASTTSDLVILVASTAAELNAAERNPVVVDFVRAEPDDDDTFASVLREHIHLQIQVFQVVCDELNRRVPNPG